MQVKLLHMSLSNCNGWGSANMYPGGRAGGGGGGLIWAPSPSPPSPPVFMNVSAQAYLQEPNANHSQTNKLTRSFANSNTNGHRIQSSDALLKMYVFVGSMDALTETQTNKRKNGNGWEPPRQPFAKTLLIPGLKPWA